MYKTFQIYYLLVGNVTSVLIIKFIGMSVGMAIWNVALQSVRKPITNYFELHFTQD